jgi:hypothetical protein
VGAAVAVDDGEGDAERDVAVGEVGDGEAGAGDRDGDTEGDAE